MDMKLVSVFFGPGKFALFRNELFDSVLIHI